MDLNFICDLLMSSGHQGCLVIRMPKYFVISSLIPEMYLYEERGKLQCPPYSVSCPLTNICRCHHSKVPGQFPTTCVLMLLFSCLSLTSFFLSVSHSFLFAYSNSCHPSFSLLLHYIPTPSFLGGYKGRFFRIWVIGNQNMDDFNKRLCPNLMACGNEFPQFQLIVANFKYLNSLGLDIWRANFHLSVMLYSAYASNV